MCVREREEINKNKIIVPAELGGCRWICPLAHMSISLQRSFSAVQEKKVRMNSSLHYEMIENCVIYVCMFVYIYIYMRSVSHPDGSYA